MKNILLPTDFSKNSYNAINYAIQLFKDSDCTFYVLNVQKQSDFILDDFMTVSPSSSIYEAIAKDNKKDLKQFISKIKNSNTTQNHTFKALFDFDNLIHAINEVTELYAIDLIIMGTNGATGAKEIIFGSNTLNVIRNVKSPVLIIPENYKFKKLENILFSTEACNDIDKKNLITLKALIKNRTTTMRVINLINSDYNQEKTNHKQCLKHLFGELNYEYQKIIDVPSPMAISTITQLLDFDLHALFVESKSFIERFLFGSNTHQISYKTRIPLLVMH